VPTSVETVDALIVGARIGGVFTAGCMARAGYSVLLVDKASFPSDTLSTHFCRGGGMLGVADRLGWLPAVEAVGAPKLTVEYSHANGEVSVAPPQDPGNVGYCMAARRLTLDAALLRAVQREPRVRVRTGTKVKNLVMEGGRVVGADLGDGSTVRARVVVGADGRRSNVARWVEAQEREAHEGMRALYFRYVSRFNPPRGGYPDGPEFSLIGDQMAYVFPCDAGLTCVALSINLATFREFRHDVATEWISNMSRHHRVWSRLTDSKAESRLFGTAPQPDWVREGAGGGWALVGDAAIHQDPWSGEGMDSAARQAEILVEVLDTAWRQDNDEWAAVYEQRRDEALLENFHATVAGSRDLSTLGV